MQFSSLIGHTAQLYRILRKSSQTGESLASDYFRSKKYIGSKERKLISELVFSSLRMASAIEYCAQKADESVPPDHEEYTKELGSVIATCIIGEFTQTFVIEKYLQPAFGVQSASEAIHQALLHKLHTDSAKAELWTQSIIKNYSALQENSKTLIKNNIIIENSEELRLFSAYCAMPEWIILSWHKHGFTCLEISQLCLSLQTSAPVGIRVNTSAMSRDSVLKILREQHIPCSEGLYSPHAIILPERIRLQETQLYQSGAIEIQDEGSQLISLAINPDSRWTILDYCAGAGGKSLHLAMLQQDKGTINATDIDFGRLKELRFRAEKAQYRSIHLLPMHDKKHGKSALDVLQSRCDAVLVDAPCTGMGTVRRTPNIKWLLKPKHVQSIHQKQVEILQKASVYVKPGGVLVYATCSLMNEENNNVIHEFLEHNDDFELSSLQESFPPETSLALFAHHNDTAMISLMPSIHGTDGFFMCRMIRKHS